MKNHRKLIILAIALIFSSIFSILFKWIQTGKPFRYETIFLGVTIFTLLLINGYLGYAILGKLSNKASVEIKKQIIPSFSLFALLAFIVSIIVISVIDYIYFLIEGYETSNFIKHLLTVELKSALIQFGIWILIASSFYLFNIWIQATKREQKLDEENLKYKYQNLKNQINPHFLFNTLNTLSELVYVDAQQSENFIHNLSSIYRYVLENEEVDFIELNKEIEFVKQYFALQQVRDGDKIKLKIEIADTSEIKVVPVSLQILVENALKHNAKSKEKPLIINIKEKNGEIIVVNPIQKKSIIEYSTKTGLSNLKGRIKIITGKDLVINNDKHIFTVKLPTLI